ncbi:hypothetical protein HR45_10895 [Shewanella mangrovi]|uniref:Uncharacterized protein n=1 Tax=Shewanella mangrovi TaxID=1515746 RepID=A0A094JE46_9GAMM|nr:hypothetical protein [Shewanella mangrovi]KFZ37507.1 hypothetical protein HR45_10895 [Shewanella mangrovi]
MSIWKELYDVVEKEFSRWQSRQHKQQTLVFEIQSNLLFLAEALKAQLPAKQIVAGLEHKAFDDALAQGLTLDRRLVTSTTIGDFDEFKKYIGKDSTYMVKNAYAKMKTLSKLVQADSQANYDLKIKSLFRFMVLLAAHLDAKSLSKAE